MEPSGRPNKRPGLAIPLHVAVGPGARNDKGELATPDVKAGDRVLFGKWSGTEVKLDGEELLIMKESDIMGIVEGTAAVRKKAA